MSTNPAAAADIVEQLLSLHNAARGCEFDLLPNDGPIARMVFFMHLHGDRIAAEIEALRAREAELQRKLDGAAQWQPMATAPVGGYIIVGGEGEDGWLMMRVRHEDGHDPTCWCLGHDDCGDPVFATHWCQDVLGSPRTAALASIRGEG